MKKNDLPKKIPIFPLNNFILFPKTTVPLNIFEPRYIDLINDSMKNNKLLGMIQPKILTKVDNNVPELHDVGCLGKITSFKEMQDGRYLIDLKGIIRFNIIKEVETIKDSKIVINIFFITFFRYFFIFGLNSSNLRIDVLKTLNLNDIVSKNLSRVKFYN